MRRPHGSTGWKQIHTLAGENNASVDAPRSVLGRFAYPREDDLRCSFKPLSRVRVAKPAQT